MAPLIPNLKKPNQPIPCTITEIPVWSNLFQWFSQFISFMHVHTIQKMFPVRCPLRGVSQFCWTIGGTCPSIPESLVFLVPEFGHAQLQTFLHTYIYVQSNCFRSCIYICTGYFFSCSAYSIAVCVIGKRVTTANGAESVYNYYVNDGIHGSFYICSANMIQTPLVPIILQVYDICFCID